MFKDKIPHFFDKDSIDQLIREHGSPLLVFDESTIRAKYKKIKETLDEFYPKNKVAYSVKTNYLPAIVSILKDCGALAEVVSDFEYWLIKKLDYKNTEIIYNGPDKSKESLEEALIGGAMVNIDSREEFFSLPFEKLKNKKIKIGIRTNTSTRSLSHQRFGFNLENGETVNFIDEVKKRYPQCVITGLHIHLSSAIKPKNYKHAAELLSDCALAIEKKWGDSMEYLDFGGGFLIPGSRFARKIFWDISDINQYIEKITNTLNKKFTKTKPILIVEPGRYLIDEAGTFITTVLHTKFVKFYRKKNILPMFNQERNIQLITIDSSKTSILKSISDVKHLKCLRRENSDITKTFPSYVVGNSCITSDYLTEEIELPKLFNGDKILFSNAGAYSISRSEQFIHPRPAVILIRENGEIECIRKRETYEDLISS